ncbi:YveK family protein [Sciscionella sediminilitoris]|uniref:YveK family protein n=1 Tax=Sciscionella sediminilitoris TaxID=1445613 RepID=UPI0004DF7031|nr:hypothetical protein [Sciscionella sp. SE31]
MRWLRDNWWLTATLAGALLGVLVMLGVSLYLGTRPVTATAQILATPGPSKSGSDIYTADQYVSQRMSTYAGLATSDRVVQPAAAGLGTTANALAAQVKATVVDNTTMLSLTVTGSDRGAAERAGIAVTRSFVDTITRLEQVDDADSRVRVEVVSPPSAADKGTRLPLGLGIPGGLLAGALLGYLVTVLARWLYPKWRQPVGALS